MYTEGTNSVGRRDVQQFRDEFLNPQTKDAELLHWLQNERDLTLKISFFQGGEMLHKRIWCNPPSPRTHTHKKEKNNLKMHKIAHLLFYSEDRSFTWSTMQMLIYTLTTLCSGSLWDLVIETKQTVVHSLFQIWRMLWRGFLFLARLKCWIITHNVWATFSNEVLHNIRESKIWKHGC